jgi:hypothetical protein
VSSRFAIVPLATLLVLTGSSAVVAGHYGPAGGNGGKNLETCFRTVSALTRFPLALVPE